MVKDNILMHACVHFGVMCGCVKLSLIYYVHWCSYC